MDPMCKWHAGEQVREPWKIMIERLPPTRSSSSQPSPAVKDEAAPQQPPRVPLAPAGRWARSCGRRGGGWWPGRCGSRAAAAAAGEARGHMRHAGLQLHGQGPSLGLRQVRLLRLPGDYVFFSLFFLFCFVAVAGCICELFELSAGEWPLLPRWHKGECVIVRDSFFSPIARISRNARIDVEWVIHYVWIMQRNSIS